MKETELNPCPNCGCQPKIHKTHKKFYVECDGDCWTQTGKHSYQEDAVKEWNTQIAVAKEGRQMTDHKFTDDEVIKALECCNTPGSCFECPYDGTNEVEYDDSCVQELIKDILPLINRQKAEIERLQAVHADMTESLRLASEANKDMSVELDAMRGAANSYKIHYEKAKSEAIKEFAERLIKKCDAPHWCVWMSEIEDLVKEMTENKR